jgi:hypothetical protein
MEMTIKIVIKFLKSSNIDYVNIITIFIVVSILF